MLEKDNYGGVVLVAEGGVGPSSRRLQSSEGEEGEVSTNLRLLQSPSLSNDEIMINRKYMKMPSWKPLHKTFCQTLRQQCDSCV